MESRYRSGNNQQSSPYIPQSSSYGFFAEQARADAYRGPEIGRAPHEFFRDHQYHPHPNPLHPHPLSHPQLRPPPHPHAIHDAILREIEKERIREEIIISEIARRRALEAEVRRELMMERELALQRGGDGFPFGSSLQMGFEPPMRLAITGPRFEGRFLDERIGMSQEETRRLTGGLENGGFETLPFQKRGADLRISEIKPASEGGKEKVILLAKPHENVSGSKRKALTPPGSDASEVPSDEILKKKSKEEWSCALCKVNATCERGLNEHLQGKRHKSKETALRAQRSEKNYSIGLLPKATKSIKSVENIDPGAEECVKCTGESLVSQKKNESELVQKVQTNDDHKKKRYNFWCEMCKVGTLTLKTMNIHKNGKKHARCVEKSNRTGGARSKKIDVLVNHVKCDDVDGKSVTSEHVDETSEETRVEDDKPVDVFEPENHEDEMKKYPMAEDEMKEYPTAVDEMKEYPADVDKMKEDPADVDKVKGDHMDEMKEDCTAVDISKSEDESTDDVVADVDKMKEYPTAEDEMKEDPVDVDEMKEDPAVDKIKGDHMDEMKEDPSAVDISKSEDELTVDVVESKEGELIVSW